MKNPTRATTLLELLTVIAVVLILSAFVMANMQEASARSRVARVRSDMRALAGALALYRTDHGAYPAAAVGDVQLLYPLAVLTTPTAYLATVPQDPFGPAGFDFAPEMKLPGYSYKDAVTTSVGMPADTYGALWRNNPERHYLLHSPGPNRLWDVTPYREYDPTNGTISPGDVSRFGPS